MSYSWGAVAGQKVTLTVQLLAPSQYGRVHGELHLKWTGAPMDGVAESVEPASRPFVERHGDSGERFLNRLIASLDAEQRAAFDREVALHEGAPTVDAVMVVPAAGERVEEPTALEPTMVTAVWDDEAPRLNFHRVMALRSAFGRPLPGPIGELVEQAWLQTR